ncbi:hypothetical protein [Streptomyces sp. NPDC088180]
MEDEEMRFATILAPPQGKARWSADDTSR